MPTLTKDRTRTALGRGIEEALTSLNDQYCFFLFLECEFIGQIKSSAEAALTEFTTDLFTNNPYASRIHVRLGSLPAFQQAHRSATFAAYFSSSYEVSSAFVDEALGALRAANTSSLTVPPRLRDGPEQYYWRTLIASGYALPAPEIIETLTFFRHKRNALVHLSTNPPIAFVMHTQRSGTNLNGFWTRAKVQIDFTDPSTGPLSERDALDALKLLRIIVQRLDAHLISILDGRGVASVEAVRMFGSQKVRMNREVAAARVKILGRVLVRDYGLTVGGGDLDVAVRAANPR
jgi:hypothetical protein